jgi:hypothetical protein
MSRQNDNALCLKLWSEPKSPRGASRVLISTGMFLFDVKKVFDSSQTTSKEVATFT